MCTQLEECRRPQGAPLPLASARAHIITQLPVHREIGFVEQSLSSGVRQRTPLLAGLDACVSIPHDCCISLGCLRPQVTCLVLDRMAAGSSAAVASNLAAAKHFPFETIDKFLGEPRVLSVRLSVFGCLPVLARLLLCTGGLAKASERSHQMRRSSGL